MGVSERKSREKEQMKSLILSTAHKLFLHNGYEETSIRNIAKAIEYSPATIYLYFRDKNEILYHLQEKSFENFMNKLNEFAFMKDHFSRLKKLSVSYVEFAIKQPALYELLFFTNPYLNEHKDILPIPDRIMKILKEAISASQSNNQFTRMPLHEAVSLVWSFLHGLSMLTMNKKITYLSAPDYSDHVNTMINRFYNNLKSGI